MELPKDAQRRVFQHRAVARLATRTPRGALRVLPIVFAWHAERFWSPIDGKAKRPGRPARLADIEHDNRATLLFDAYHDDWQALWWLRVQVRAHIVRGGEGAATGASPGVAGVAEGVDVLEVADALRRKYPQYARVPLFQDADAPTLICFTPERIRSWMASPAALAFTGAGGEEAG